jgi:CRISPR-associated protein Cas1
MNPLVLTSKATFVSVRDHQLRIVDYMNRSEVLYRARHLPFDHILIYKAGGNVSFEAVRFLMQNGVPIVHLSWDGSQVGMTLPPGPISGELRVAQYQTFLNKERREQLACAFVEEKVSKSIQLLRFLARRYPAIDLSGVKSISPSLPLMLFEGKIAEAYWAEFSKVIQSMRSRFEFLGRKTSSNNMGASDPVNSLLNYGYGILEARVRLAIQKVGLDPDIGFLHVAQSGATPLVYDVMELFRWLVDLTVVELLESKSIKPEGFLTDPEYKVFLKEDAAHRVAERLTQNFNRTTKVGKQELQYETILDMDVRKMSRFIRGELKVIDFAYPFSADDSKVDAEQAVRLLNLSIDERKRLGIQKTTYFYIKKNLEAGKRIRLYGKVRRRLLSPGN